MYKWREEATREISWKVGLAMGANIGTTFAAISASEGLPWQNIVEGSLGLLFACFVVCTWGMIFVARYMDNAAE